MSYSIDNCQEIKKEVIKYCIKNRESIIGFDTMSEEDREHIYAIAYSIVMTREKVLSGGEFVQAICKNDLKSAVCLADKECIRALKLFVFVYLHFHIIE
ncbi:hypothetical protein M0Q50_09275 [bacterium]|jgi:hypothetical protein|nr:hypothetical protein [bacterium]